MAVDFGSFEWERGYANGGRDGNGRAWLEEIAIKLPWLPQALQGAQALNPGLWRLVEGYFESIITNFNLKRLFAKPTIGVVAYNLKFRVIHILGANAYSPVSLPQYLSLVTY